MPDVPENETDAFWSLGKRCGVLAGTWNLAGNPETWRDMAKGCSQWVSFSVGGPREPRGGVEIVGKNIHRSGVCKGATMLWWSQICTIGGISAPEHSVNKRSVSECEPGLKSFLNQSVFAS